MMRVRCQCGATYEVGEEMAGRTAKCRCGALLRMPAAAASADAGVATGGAVSTATSSSPPVADSISVTCASCQRQHQAPKSMAGRFARCPCGNALQIPHPYAATPGLVPLGPNASQATAPLLGIPVDPLTGQSHDGSLLDDLTHVDYERAQQLSTPSALQAPPRRSEASVLASHGGYPEQWRKQNSGSESDYSGAFGFEKRLFNSGILGGLLFMGIAAAWFIVGLFNGYLFYYPPVMFLLGFIGFVRGLMATLPGR
ncbi:MAG: hypothetical protein KDA55_10960 [Planctomycetales bacterium]|nr:hypothetical protein [Planctomycetales bacterium]